MNITFTGLPPICAPRPTAQGSHAGLPLQRRNGVTSRCSDPRFGDDPMKITFTGFLEFGERNTSSASAAG